MVLSALVSLFGSFADRLDSSARSAATMCRYPPPVLALLVGAGAGRVQAQS